MPVPPGYSSRVYEIPDPSESSLNTMLQERNQAGEWCSDIKIMDSTQGVMLCYYAFISAHPGDLRQPYAAPQRIRQLDNAQAILDSDASFQAAQGYLPSGIFVDTTTPGSVYVLYTQLTTPAISPGT